MTAPRGLSLSGRAPYPVPPPGAPVRVAFVGQRTYFEACAVHHELPGLMPAFVDFRGGANVGEMLATLTSFAPHVVVVFRPEILPPGIFAGLTAAVLGFTTEPLSPSFGLEPGLDFLEVADADEFRLRVHEAHATPEVHHLVRVRGRDKGEQFRASTVWPRVVRDLLDDLAAFGTER